MLVLGKFPKVTLKRYEVSHPSLELTATIDVTDVRLVVARSNDEAMPEIARTILNARQKVINLFKDAYFTQNGRDIDDEYIDWHKLKLSYLRRVPRSDNSSRK